MENSDLRKLKLKIWFRISKSTCQTFHLVGLNILIDIVDIHLIWRKLFSLNFVPYAQINSLSLFSVPLLSGPLFVNFLWLHTNRKNLIQKKIYKLKNGKKIGNLLHKQHNDLTNKELKLRYDNFIKYYKHKYLLR